MTYDELLTEASIQGINVKEKPLTAHDGRIRGCNIAIRNDIPTIRKACVLAEEIGHYETTVGNILDQDNISNRKQERHARLWAYNKQIGLLGILNAFKAHCHTPYAMSEYLGVTEEFLLEALECYRQRYGTGEWIDNYIIKFEPQLEVFEYCMLTKF